MMHEHFVRVVGNGQPIIFLPGTGWSGDIGLHIADSVKNSYQVHVIDLPGIGQSQGLERFLMNSGKTNLFLIDWEQVHNFIIRRGRKGHVNKPKNWCKLFIAEQLCGTK